MSTIPFTDRELKRAWRELLSIVLPVQKNMRKNPYRLLLFYAVECGLKAVWLRRQNRTLFEREHISNTGHNLRKLLKLLNVGAGLDLPHRLELDPVKHNGSIIPRTGDIGILHQTWRYGGKCQLPTDQECEQKLERILNWIQGELK